MTFVAAALGAGAGYLLADSLGVSALTGVLGGAAIGGSIGGGVNAANAATQAAQTQAASTDKAAELQRLTAQENIALAREMYNKQLALGTPYRQAGEASLQKISGMLPYFTQQQPTYKPFTAADLQTNLAPNYQFMRQQGLGAIGQQFNVGGGGSNIDLAKTKFAEDYASNAYQNALENYRTQQELAFNQGQAQTTNIYNRLSNIAGLGQTAAGQATSAAGNLGTNVANISTGAANAIGQLGVGGASALGAGQIGAANAYNNTISQLGNAGLMYSLLRKG